MTPKVSIVIPVYEVEEFLPRCLESVMAQTFDDWEAICVNDGSRDKSGEILSRYAKRDKRFRIFEQANLGVSAARNKAMLEARGQYLAFLDADDELFPGFLEKMLQALVETNADFAWCDYQEGEEIGAARRREVPPGIYDDILLRFLEENPNMGVAIWNKLYKKELLEGCLFPAETGMGEDQVFLYKALWRASKAVYVGEELYFYRRRGNSAMNRGLDENMVLGNIKTAELMARYFADKDLPANARRILERKIAKRIFKFAILEPRRKDKANLDKWYNLTRPRVAKLLQSGVYRPRNLGLKNRLLSWLFLKGR